MFPTWRDTAGEDSQRCPHLQKQRGFISCDSLWMTWLLLWGCYGNQLACQLHVWACVALWIHQIIYLFYHFDLRSWTCAGENLPAPTLNVSVTGDTGSTDVSGGGACACLASLFLLFFLFCRCWGWWWWWWWWWRVHLDACRWALPFLYRSAEAESEGEWACVRVTRTRTRTHTCTYMLSSLSCDTDLSVAKNGKHTCCCWEARRRLDGRRACTQGFMFTPLKWIHHFHLNWVPEISHEVLSARPDELKITIRSSHLISSSRTHHGHSGSQWPPLRGPVCSLELHTCKQSYTGEQI